MKQLRLGVKREKPNIAALRKVSASANEQLARVILENPERCAGLQVQWAEAVARKNEKSR